MPYSHWSVISLPKAVGGSTTIVCDLQSEAYLGFSAPGDRNNEVRPPQSRAVGITPTVRFSVKDTLWLPELNFFFCKVTTSKFTAKH